MNTDNGNDAIHLAPDEQLARAWQHVQDHQGSKSEQCERHWPTYDRVMTDMAQADYHHTLSCPFDVLKSASQCPRNAKSTGYEKTICPHGAVCCVRLELFPHQPAGHDESPLPPYTGLLTPGITHQPCLMRLSSAMRPPKEEVQSRWARGVLYACGDKLRNARLFPTSALKIFRQHRHSGNLLFGGSKIGQREHDYFQHCQCTTMTEQMPRMVKPFVRKFWEYSDYPLSLGVSDFCWYNVDGSAVERPEFPFCLILKPCLQGHELAADTEAVANDAFDDFLDQVLHIAAGTVLFDIFACRAPQDVPDASKLERIGRIVTTSAMAPSSADDGLFFRHQKKEEDYALRPTWPVALQTEVTMDNGQRKGTIGKLAGWKLFEQHIAENSYIDCER